MQRIAAAHVLVSASASSAAQPAVGVVFIDANADGLRQADEPGLPRVAVTNGLDVVLTAEDGSYTIPVTDDTIVSVVKPAGYQVPLDPAGLPRFYYIHKPAGSPDEGFIFQGVEPTGPLPDSIDFPLTPVQEPDSYTVLVFGDPQPYTPEQVDMFRREVIDPLVIPGSSGPRGNAARALFGISLGDLVGDDLRLFEPLNQAQGLLGVPWYNVYGNHDMNFMSGHSSPTSADPDRYADETYERVYGPANYAFQVGRAHYIVLDDVIWQGYDGMDDRPAETWPDGRKPKNSNYRGGLRDDQLLFIENYLKVVPKDHLVVLAFHIPIEGEDVHRIPEQSRLFEILSSHPHTLSLSGHTHFQRHWFFGPEHGYTASAPNQHSIRDPRRFPQPVHHHLNAVTASGSWFSGDRDEFGLPHTTMRDGAPNGYTLLHVSGVRYHT
jgi:hypothetical protein